MTRFAYTPGPWTVSAGNLIRVYPKGSTGSPVCGVHVRGRDGDIEERRAIAEANARLIAAAPDMRKSLNPELLRLIANQQPSPFISQLIVLAELQDAAIAKVLGVA